MSENGNSDDGASGGCALILILLLLAVIGGWCSWDGIEHGIQRIACERAVCPTPEVR